MIEDDPAILEEARLKALRQEFQLYAMRHHPAVDLYGIIARFTLAKIKQAENGEPVEYGTGLAQSTPLEPSALLNGLRQYQPRVA